MANFVTQSSSDSSDIADDEDLETSDEDLEEEETDNDDEEKSSQKKLDTVSEEEEETYTGIGEWLDFTRSDGVPRHSSGSHKILLVVLCVTNILWYFI